MAHDLRLEPGTLAAAIARRSRSARRAGALLPMATRVELLPEQGIAFVVRVLAALARKRELARRGDREVDPFLDFEEELFVAEISDTYMCLLNKFNAVDGHVLLVTRDPEEQEEPLGAADFTALFACLRETDGLGFYNAGHAAGASQRHRHLQLVPLPLGPGCGFPLEPRLSGEALEGRVVLASSLPFPVAVARIEALASRNPEDAAPPLAELYAEMLRRTGVRPGRTPYNLLATRRLLWLVPRRLPEWEGIPVNALGFAGALLVPDEAALDRLRALGALALLRAVAGPSAAAV